MTPEQTVFYWIGIVHIVAYCAVGGFILLTIAVMKVHMWFRIMGRIIEWHIARARWNRRHKDGLTDAEWQRGKPRP